MDEVKMKRLIGAALLLTLVSCGEQSKSKSNKGPSGNSTTTQDINTQTNFTNPNPYRCLLDIDLIEIKALETTKLEEKNKKKKKKKANVTADQEKVFNLVLPDEITKNATLF